jgi:ribosomal protein S18 acetylase RimI-like enzyme
MHPAHVAILLGRRGRRHDSAARRSTPYGWPVGVEPTLDRDLAERLLVHEARAQQTPSRELRDLGDGWLFHDPSDAEPYWNRLIAPRWPADTGAFDRRLDEVITLFATLARLPHIRPLPIGSEPPDLAARLAARGFESVGADRRMVLVETGRVDAIVAAAEARVADSFGSRTVRASRHSIGAVRGPAGRRWSDRRRWAHDAAEVLLDAFGVDEARRVALQNDVLACVTLPGCSLLVLRLAGEPVAIARRATTADGSYLSSIGTRRGYRRRGLGALATALAMRDAMAESGPLIHLSVEADNEAARRLYEGLGFVAVGDPAPDLLLR